MGPTIQLIQLTLRVEREAEAQRRLDIASSADRGDQTTVRASKRERRDKSTVDLLPRQPQCECA